MTTRSTGTRKRRLRLIARRTGLILSSLLVVALLFEVGLRVFGIVDASIKESHPVIGERYVPNFEGEIYVSEVEKRVHIRINESGFRGVNRPQKKPNGVRRVALIGDSFIAAMASEEKDTAAVQLEQLLNESDEANRWEVLNFGISGAGTGTELVVYREVARHYKPDFVVCVVYIDNDISDNSPELSWKSGRIYFALDDDRQPVQLPYASSRRGATNWLNRNSRLYVWQKRLIARARSAISVDTDVVARIYKTKPSREVADSWEVTGKLLKMFRDEVHAHGSRFVVVAIPSPRQVYDDLWKDFVDGTDSSHGTIDRDFPDKQLTRMCATADIPLLLLRPAFRKATPSRSADKEDEWLIIKGRGHFNRAGNRLTAQEIHRFLDGLR